MSAPFNMILTIDAETVWDSKEYTLSKMTTEEYVRSPRFHAFGFCLHEFGTTKPTQWYSHAELPRIFRMYDWSKTAVLAHNSAFDAAILSFIYGVQPCFIFDSLSMARALRGVEVGNSLAKLAEAYGLPPKGRAVHSTDGRDEITPEIEKELADYCAHDVYLCEAIFAKLMARDMTPYSLPPTPPVFLPPAAVGKYPPKELRLIDMTIQMFTRPELVLDKDMLVEALKEETTKLAQALERVAVDEETLASNDQFAVVLRTLGVEPPTKPSPANKEKQIYAFAKNDALFQALLNGDNEDVALLCEARMRVKSTSVRTRAQRFIDIAERGPLTVPLKYYAAGTGRWGGMESINLQNMKRGSALRMAIMAPEGYVICAGDLSQIEPKVLAWLADYDELLDIFRSGKDAYATFGAQMFNMPGMTKDSNPVLRQSAKSALLGAGYSLGWAALAAQLLVGFLGAPPKRYTKTEALQLGVTSTDVQKFLSWEENLKKMAEIPHTCSDVELVVHCLAAKAIIDKYRATAYPVTNLWALLSSLIERSLIGGEVYDHKGVLQFRRGEIEMVNGMCLRYPDIQGEKDEKGRIKYSYNDGKKRKNLYAGSICNNITQGTARIIMTDGMLRIQSRYRILCSVHDESWQLIPEQDADAGRDWVKEQMVQVPKWMPGIPLNADVGTHKRYGLAKH